MKKRTNFRIILSKKYSKAKSKKTNFNYLKIKTSRIQLFYTFFSHNNHHLSPTKVKTEFQSYCQDFSLKTDILSSVLTSAPGTFLNFNKTESFVALTVFYFEINFSLVYELPSQATSPSNTYPPCCNSSESPLFKSTTSADSTNLLNCFSVKICSKLSRLWLCLTE